MTTLPFAQIVYALCALTSALTALLLMVNFRKTGFNFLFWSALCFAGLTMNNVLLFLDMVVFPSLDLAVIRTLPAVLGFGALLVGFIWDTV